MEHTAPAIAARLLIGIDPGLASGGVVAIDRTGPSDRCVAAHSMVEARGAIKQARERVAALQEPLLGWGDNEFNEAVVRAEAWMHRFRAALDEIETAHGPIDAFAIESFVDQRSRAREEQGRLVKKRWMAPLLMGMLDAELSSRGASVAGGQVLYQNAGVVIRQRAAEISRWESLRTHPHLHIPVFAEGDDLLTNDHLRKAAAHALALSLRMPRPAAAADNVNPAAALTASA